MSTMQYLWNLINTFYKKHPKKPTAMSPLVDIALFIAKLIIWSEAQATKQKRRWLAKANNAKYAKKSWELEILSRFWLYFFQKQIDLFVIWS